MKPACRNGRRLHDRVDAYLCDTGELICKATRQPRLDSARALLDRGYLPTDIISKVWARAPHIVTMRAPIGVAAQYDVMGEKFVRRKTFAAAMGGVETANSRSAASKSPNGAKVIAEVPHKRLPMAKRKCRSASSPSSAQRQPKEKPT